MVIRSWEVLDTRSNPSSVYEVQVIRKNRKFFIVQNMQDRVPTSNRIATRILERNEALDPTSYTDRELCESMALAFVLGLEEQGCLIADAAMKL